MRGRRGGGGREVGEGGGGGRGRGGEGGIVGVKFVANLPGRAGQQSA